MNKIIPYGKQFIDKDDINNVGKTLKRNFLTTGPLVEKFENKINSFLNSKYSIVCNSGTSAIHLACLAIDIKKDDQHEDMKWWSIEDIVNNDQVHLYTKNYFHPFPSNKVF